MLFRSYVAKPEKEKQVAPNEDDDDDDADIAIAETPDVDDLPADDDEEVPDDIKDEMD